jgi:hypothetical protein
VLPSAHWVTVPRLLAPQVSNLQLASLFFIAYFEQSSLQLPWQSSLAHGADVPQWNVHVLPAAHTLVPQSLPEVQVKSQMLPAPHLHVLPPPSQWPLHDMLPPLQSTLQPFPQTKLQLEPI